VLYVLCRYVHYFAGLLSAAIRLNNNPLYLQRIVLHDLYSLQPDPKDTFTPSPLRVFVKIYQSMQPVYVSTI